MKISSLPKAFLASALTSSKLTPTSSIESQRLIPRPPPPAAAFKITGKPNSAASFSASSLPERGFSVPGIVGTLQVKAISLAESLSPIMSKISDLGPINLIPAFSHSLANSAFSARKP